MLEDLRRDEAKHPMTAPLLEGEDYPDDGAGQLLAQSPVWLKIGNPKRETPEGDYYCPVDIGGDKPFPTVGFGVTPIQSLRVALRSVVLVLQIQGR